MRKSVIQVFVLASMVLAVPLFRGIVLAQEAKPPAQSDKTKAGPGFRVEYVVREMEEGKQTNSRRYTLLVSNDRTGKLRVGSRVPFTVQEKQFQYFDMGMNIDCRVVDQGSALLLTTFLESSSVAATRTLNSETSNPVTRQVRFEEDSEVLPGKPTVIGTLDDVGSNRKHEVEVTVTKVM